VILDAENDTAARAMLWTLLKPDRIGEAPGLEALLSQLAVSPAYARNHLLSIGTWPQDVVALLRAGLALTVARRLAQVPEDVRDAAVREARGGLFEGTWSQRVLASLDRVEQRLAATMTHLQEGWLPASAAPKPPDVNVNHDVWQFPTLPPLRRASEELHPSLIKAILARHTTAGQRVVDLTAGAGGVGRAAREYGCTSWSGDINPRAPFVHRADATDVRFEHGLSQHAADLVVLHPPTYFSWLRQRPYGAVDGREGYSDLVARMILSAARVVRRGGRIVTISRPIRSAGRVYAAIGDLQNELEAVGAKLVGYHLGVDVAGREDWHVLVGQMDEGDS
jgi:predicted RNA methylase